MATNGNFASTIQGHLVPIAYAQIVATGLLTAVGLPSIPDGAKLAMIQVTGQNLRWRDDGVNPTASVGMKLVANDMLVYTGVLSAIKFIEETTSAVLNVTYYK